ncbi:MAG TPA: DNA alkylation repair protein [Polyangiales bacterium]
MTKPTRTVRARELATRIERELGKVGEPERAEQEKRYLKSTLVHFGVSVPATRKLVHAAWRQSGALTRADLLQTVELLWARGVYELRSAAVMLLEAHGELLQAADLPHIERLIRNSHTWALVDELAARVTGALVERFPRLLRTLDRWAKDDDFWVRRSAMLALLLPLRRGEGAFERFARYADTMLEQEEFFIRKAIGWVLRETSKERPELVYRWLLPRAARASTVTLREAVKYLPAKQRTRVLQASRSS